LNVAWQAAQAEAGPPRPGDAEFDCHDAGDYEASLHAASIAQRRGGAD
jgi:hypothetical protein